MAMAKLTLIADAIIIVAITEVPMENKKVGADFLHLKLEGYRNVNDLYKQHTQLHACETLFGDWDAQVMILAQDPANFGKLEKLYEKNPNENPYHHDPKVKTNQNLYEIINSLDQFDLGSYCNPNNRKCGVYYANAIWFLKESKDMSGVISNKKNAYIENKKIFFSTLQNLPNLKFILTLGKEAYDFSRDYFGEQIDSNWHTSVIEKKIQPILTDGKSYQLGAIYHTSTRGMIARAKRSGISGSDSLKKGVRLTKLDVKSIFENLNFKVKKLY